MPLDRLTAPPDLWSIVYGTPWIDPRELCAAVEAELRGPRRDFRTRLLLRDAVAALSRRWGAAKLRSALPPDLFDEAERLLRADDLGDAGFPSLERRMSDATKPQTILQFLRELGDRIASPARLELGGSAALILPGLLSRATEDLDAVDEVPASVRIEHELLHQLTDRFGLRLAHFQSHYLPTGWETRLRSLGRFGKLDVYLVDPLDIAVGKLFSARDKDRDDLRMVEPSLGKAAMADRLRSTAQRLLVDPALAAQAERNWYLLFGESLPA